MKYTKMDLGTLRKREYIGGGISFLLWQLGFPLAAVYIAWWLGFREGTPMLSVLLQVGALVATALVVAAVFWRFLREQLARLRACGSGIWKHVGLGLVVWYGLSYAATILLNVIISNAGLQFENANNELAVDYLRTAPVLMLAATVVLTPLVEECLLRGLIFCPIARYSRVLAYAVSMLVFASLHLIAGIGSVSAPVLLLALLQYLPASFALAWVYDRSGTIWASIFLHAAINLIASALNLVY